MLLESLAATSLTNSAFLLPAAAAVVGLAVAAAGGGGGEAKARAQGAGLSTVLLLKLLGALKSASRRSRSEIVACGFLVSRARRRTGNNTRVG